jgi:hypothetical protein
MTELLNLSLSHSHSVPNTLSLSGRARTNRQRAVRVLTEFLLTVLTILMCTCATLCLFGDMLLGLSSTVILCIGPHVAHVS